MTRPVLTASLALLLAPFGALAEEQAAPTPAPFHWHDDYTEYHLEVDGEAGAKVPAYRFRIVYYVAQRQTGLPYVLNQTRSGSAGSGISVTDPRTGRPLKFDYMTGKELAAAGVGGRLSPDEHYIRAYLARPVPQGGEGRVRIDKTYTDEKSFSGSDGAITFARSLGIGRNLIVLPRGYQLVSSNVAADIMTGMDGRVALSFENINGYASDVAIRAERRGMPRDYAIAGGPAMPADFTKVLFELEADGSIRFRLQLAKGVGGDGVIPLPLFCNVADAKAFDMDMGMPVAIRAPQQAGHVPTVIVTPAPPRGATAHVVVAGTLKDPNYKVGPVGLSWERAFIEPRVTIVLPAGFEVTGVRTPVTTGTLPDGRMYVQIVNTRIATAVRVELWAGKKLPVQ